MSLTSSFSSGYNTVPRIETQLTNNIIEFGAGPNPVELGPVSLRNVRGNVTVRVTDPNTNFVWAFIVNGGYGEFQLSPTRNWTVLTRTLENCSLTPITTNVFQFNTDAPDNRTYVFTFSPNLAFGPTIEKTGGAALIGNLIVEFSKPYFRGN